MRLLILSDLHFEFHRDGGLSFVESLPKTDEVDVCILAGDIAVGRGIPGALGLFCDRYRHVLFTHGNHEYYSTDRESALGWTWDAVEHFDNLTWLHTQKELRGAGAVEIEGQRFIGSTLWFKEAKRKDLKSHMTDFRVIEGFEEWVYDENAETRAYLELELAPGDVVVTHHIPTYKSVHALFEGEPLNAYFVCDMEPLIQRVQPKLWVHGHTHFSFDYCIGKTRVVCNPFGYARREENAKFNFDCIVEV